jgi:hypothetical protein
MTSTQDKQESGLQGGGNSRQQFFDMLTQAGYTSQSKFDEIDVDFRVGCVMFADSEYILGSSRPREIDGW